MHRLVVLSLAVACLAAGVATAPGTAAPDPTDAGPETVPLVESTHTGPDTIPLSESSRAGPEPIPRAPATDGADGGAPSPEIDADTPAPSNDSERLRIVGVHPNPIADRDRGEFVLIAVPTPTNLSGWTLSDGETTIRLPNRTVQGTIAVSAEPAAARNLTDHPVAGAHGLRLANAGETVRLRHRGVVVDAITYEDAPEGEVYTGGQWRAIGATDRPVAVTEPDSVEAFVLPDAPGVPLEAIREAEERILLAGYTLTSERIARELRRAARRGVRVRVLVDAAPVGGMPRTEARLLEALNGSGVDVRVFGGDGAPYAIHHAKYAVVDDRALVVTENFKPAGTGGRSSRGWGTVVHDPAVAAELAAVFRADANERASVPWAQYRDDATFVESDRAAGEYPRRFRARTVPVEEARVLVAPDNAERGMVDALDGADRSIRVEQVSMERGPLLNATLRAAERGVRVRILLSGAWYVREDNERLVRELNRRATEEGLDLEARIADPRSRFEKIHAKGAVVDGRTVVLGSLNWNDHSPERNREVVVVLSGEQVGRYYGRVFRADWRGGAWRLPAGLAVAVLVAIAGAGGVGRRVVTFESDDGTDVL